jgi:pimeloyl-ACP methyl ester carboxylesterase
MRFVLVHGGMHGGWCWDKLIPELELLGAKAIAPDLPGHGQRQDEEATLDSYRDAVVEVVEDGDILVGHSMGGSVISVVADAIPARLGHLIYLAAPIPIEGQPLVEVAPDLSSIGTVDAEYLWVTDPDAANRLLYHDCTPEDQRWAFERLQRQALQPVLTPISVPRLWDGTVPRSFVLCLDDRTGVVPLTEGALERLGIQTVYPIWASHSPFISRPRDLARVLVSVVDSGVGSRS